jgi:hypothetical protein
VGKRDADLEFYLATGLVRWLGLGEGYEITAAGRNAVLAGAGEARDGET